LEMRREAGNQRGEKSEASVYLPGMVAYAPLVNGLRFYPF